jgi:hypothetical protein
LANRDHFGDKSFVEPDLPLVVRRIMASGYLLCSRVAGALRHVFARDVFAHNDLAGWIEWTA